MSALIDEARTVWQQHLAEQPVEDIAVEPRDTYEPESELEHIAAVVDINEVATTRPELVYDAAQAVAALDHGYVAAALDYAAAVVAENIELRRIAAAALVQAKEATRQLEIAALPDGAYGRILELEYELDQMRSADVKLRWWKRWFR